MTIDELIAQAEADGIQKFVVGAFVMQGDRFLIVKRSEHDDFLPGLDEIPSGGVDEGETLEIALAREVLEETGLVVDRIVRYCNAFDYLSSSGKKARQLNFLISVADPAVIRLNPAEHSAYCWCAAHDPAFGQLNFSAETRQCLVDAAVMMYG